MPVLSDTQLAAVLRRAGFPAGPAAVLVACAHPESGADPSAIQQGQPYATTGWGLWQITPGNSVPGVGTDRALLSPQRNADAAYQKWRDQGLGAWTTYTSGKYQPYYPAAQKAVAKVYGMSPARVRRLASQAGGGGGSIYTTAATSGGSGAGSSLASMLHVPTALFHGVALILDRAFVMFQPGQGWRLAFGALAVASGVGAERTVRATAEADDGAGLPLAILLTGVTAAAAFMAVRPWPQAHTKPLTPGAYVVDMLSGHPPAAGPKPADDTQAIQDTLLTIFFLWGAAKIARVLSGTTSSIASILGAAGLGAAAGAGGTGGAPGAPAPDIPPIEDIPIEGIAARQGQKPPTGTVML